LDSIFNFVNNSSNSSCLNILFLASVSNELNKECILVKSNSSLRFVIALHLLLIYLFLLQKASSLVNLSVIALSWHAWRFSLNNSLYFSSKNFNSSCNSSILNNILCYVISFESIDFFIFYTKFSISAVNVSKQIWYLLTSS